MSQLIKAGNHGRMCWCKRFATGQEWQAAEAWAKVIERWPEATLFEISANRVEVLASWKCIETERDAQVWRTYYAE